MQLLEQIPDGIKVTAATSASVLTIMGISVEQWTFIFSIVVSVLFIIEKLPKVIKICMDLYRSLFNRNKE